jgi:hypothetical protein
MKRTSVRALVGALTLAAVGCAESSTSPDAASDLLANAFTTSSAGFGSLTSSYDATTAQAVWVPGPGGPGRNGLAFGGLMGGGLGGEFAGAVGFDGGHHGPHDGPFGIRGGRTCTGGTFAAATGRVTCPAETNDGLTITRSFLYANAAGTVQQAYDSLTTNTINTRVDVTGTTTFTADTTRNGGRGHDGHGGPGFFGLGRGLDSSGVRVLTATTTVRHASSQTVGGLVPSSTRRTVDGTSSGTESSTGTTSGGTFSSTRTQGDTTRGLVIPVSATTQTYPTAGTVIRAMTATVTLQGKAAQTSTRREVVTYDGTATAKLTITQDGTTKSCTVALPRGRPACS